MRKCFSSFLLICFVLSFLLGLDWIIPTNPAYGQIVVSADDEIKRVFVDNPPAVLSMSFSHTAADFSASSATQSERISLDFPHYRAVTIQIRSATLVEGDMGTATYQVKITSSANQVDDDIYTLPYRHEFDNTGNVDLWVTIPTIENYGAYEIGDWVLGAQSMVIVASGVDNVSREVEISFE